MSSLTNNASSEQQLDPYRDLGSALSAARSLLRTGFYAGVTGVAARMTKPLGEVEREYGRHALRDAYSLHRKMLARPGMREVMRRASLEDWLTLPFFLASAPFDVMRVAMRARRGQTRGTVEAPDGFPYPDYYLNDFHHQPNGNLSLRSALTYEWQIRFLFMGCSRLMRQALIDEIPRGDRLDILDVGCGTASWITQARLQGRNHRVTGIDLSNQYLSVARLLRSRSGGGDAAFLQMNAEELASDWNGRFDAIVCIWMFHEMPTSAIERAASEMKRVIKPGGSLFFMDAAQPDDVPEGRKTIEGISDRFRDFVNEPHFRHYQALDLPDLFERNGFRVEKIDRCYASKIMRLRAS
jgi:ubiquinone/menaquinone biosynthesis C-methylase UbiE